SEMQLPFVFFQNNELTGFGRVPVLFDIAIIHNYLAGTTSLGRLCITISSNRAVRSPAKGARPLTRGLMLWDAVGFRAARSARRSGSTETIQWLAQSRQAANPQRRRPNGPARRRRL